jgi:hypothetical protein
MKIRNERNEWLSDPKKLQLFHLMKVIKLMMIARYQRNSPYLSASSRNYGDVSNESKPE